MSRLRRSYPARPRKILLATRVGTNTTWLLQAALSGNGNLTSAATRQARIATSISGNGNLTSALTRQARLAIPISGNGNLTSALTRQARGAASISGNGNMTTALTRQARVASAISGHGDLTAAATYQLRIAASISGNGNLVSALTRQARLVAAVDGNGNMSSAMRLIAHLQAPLSGHGDMTAAAIGSTSTPAVRRKKRRGDMSFTFQQKVVSTATPLLSSAVYTSSIIESNLFGMLTGVVYADQAGVFTLQAWNEANGTYYTVYTLSVVGGVASPITHDIIAPKYKAVYTNAGTNQTVFALTLYINT